jgi:hypothetical protein
VISVRGRVTSISAAPGCNGGGSSEMESRVECVSLVVDPTLRDTSEVAAAIAGALIVATFLIALVVDVGFTAKARRWLAFGFAGLPARPAEAVSVFMHNLGALLAVAGLLVIAQTPYWAGEAQPGRSHRLVRGAGEVLLSGAVAANVAVVGASFGAYGARMIRAALPHGPLELGAFSLALGLYMKGRDRRIPVGLMVVVGVLSVAGLALAALLEVYVTV